MIPAALLLASLSLPTERPAPAVPAYHPEGLTAFAIDLLRACGDAPGNVNVAPISVARALGMARLGAKESTAAQIDRVLRTDGLDVAHAFRDLAGALEPATITHDDRTKGPAFTLDLSSAVFAQSGFPLLPAFETGLRDGFRSEGLRVDFARADAAAQAINAWVERSTHGRLTVLVQPSDLGPVTRVVLVDAVFFHAAWNEPFQEFATADAPFTTAAGETRTVKMMRRTDGYAYGETERASVLEVTHEGGATSMVFVLPRVGTSTKDLVDHEGFDAWFGALKEGSRVDARLPRFTCERLVDLKSALVAMGVTDLFDASKCNLTGVTTRETLFVSAVIHRARLAIDEHGTEAAAATALVMKAGARPPQPSATFVLDRPFLFALRHRTAGIVLFCGRVDDPLAK